MLVPGQIIMFDGGNAAIPAGFIRDDRFNDRLPLISTTNAGQTGGVSTHTHTGSNSHVMNSHTHTAPTTTSTFNSPSNSASDGGNGAGGHFHYLDMSKATFTTSGSLSGNVSYAASSHVPLSHQFIFIRAQRHGIVPPQGCVLAASPLAGYDYHQASAGKFIIGAPAGADAGGTVGSATHTHDVSHTHNAMTHTHTLETGTAGGYANRSGSGGTNMGTHSHTFTISQSLTGDRYTGTCPAYANNPLHATIRVYKNNTSGSLPVRRGLITFWTNTDLPLGWVECDGTNGTPNLQGYYLKNSTSETTTLTTGGSNTHSHPASNSHTHSQSHNHGGSATSSWVSGSGDSAGNWGHQADAHDHTLSGIESTTATWQAASISSNSATLAPPYIYARAIMATNKALGSSAMVYQNFR